MIYVDKNGNIYNDVVTDKDVIVTSGNQIGKDLKTILDEQQSDINKLKSNVKHIFLNGGVGGNGSGGSGGGSGTSDPVLNVLLNNNSVVNNGSPILLNGPGKYDLYFKVRNAGGKDYYVTYFINGETRGTTISLKSDNRCEATKTINLNSNGEIVVRFMDADQISLTTDVRQSYIVSPHTFNARLYYKNTKGESVPFSTNEYFMGSTTELHPFIKISYSINIPDVEDVTITTSIGGVDIEEPIKNFGNERNGEYSIELETLKKDGEDFIQTSNTGLYNIKVDFKYIKNANPQTASKEMTLILIPFDLFVNITADRDVLYASEALLENDKIEGIPVKNVNQGSYIKFYGYVYQGSIQGARKVYNVTYSVDEYIGGEWVENPDQKVSYQITEQTVDSIGFTTSFVTPGIKRIKLTTSSMKGGDIGQEKTFEKYIYVKEYISKVDWRDLSCGGNLDFDEFFKVNQVNVYSSKFPELPSKNNPFEMKRNGSTYEIKGDNTWTTHQGQNFSTVISFGIQLSNVNEDDAKILDIYLPDIFAPEFTLYSTHLFTPVISGDNKIQIPIEETYNSSISTNYHLIQIIREYKAERKYVDYLYIDGLLESCNWNLSEYPLFVSKIVLNNVNISYNLINIQYISNGVDGDEDIKPFNSDATAYAYNLAYKDKVISSGSLTDEELYFYGLMSEVSFDGTNVKISDTVATNIAKNVGIPSMMIEHILNGETVEEAMNNLFVGRTADNEGYGDKNMNLYWCAGNGDEFEKIECAEIQGFMGSWRYTLQGTSTMSNRIKNFSLKYVTTSKPGDADLNDAIVVSPNFKEVEPGEKRARTFLPEQEWTIKADIADSAHANNTCIGKFVNETTTQFKTSMTLVTDAKKYIRNTLEGFPILMFFKCGDDVYYFGVYNFNMGRSSYFNLGYNIHTDDLYRNCTTQGSYITSGPFVFTVVDCTRSDVCVGEIQENSPEFDFHQYDSSVLFRDGMQDRYNRMFGDTKDIVCHNYENAKSTLLNLVRDVALAGTHCYNVLKKDMVSSRLDYGEGNITNSSEESVNRYTEKINQVPSISEQMYYNESGRHWRVNNTSATLSDLETLLLSQIGERDNEPRLDYTSASEYFTICMGFGLVDSVVKNMNIKSWDGVKCYTAFYDMDCALGEENTGKEIVVYNAGTDYWFSNINEETRKVQPIDIYYDHWENAYGKGFDYPSSYLFAVVKYGKSILGNDGKTLGHCPQEFWAELRTPTGELRSVDYFIENYFKSGIKMIPEYLASLNYKVKYLYTKNPDSSNPTYIENHVKFNGSRNEKVKVWLSKRVQFMDVMMNVMGIDNNILDVDKNPTGVVMPKPDNDIKAEVLLNPNVSIAQCAFTTGTGELLGANSGVNTDVYITAAPNTPFILKKGEEYEIYIFPSPLTETNMIHLNWEQAKNMKFYGSKAFVDIDKIEPFFTRSNLISSDCLEHIRYSGLTIQPMTDGLSIISTSVKTIDLDIPALSGDLKIDNGVGKDKPYGQSIESINISGSGLYGTFENLSNLNRINISGVDAKSSNITISGCDEFSGDNSYFSGLSNERKTKLTTLQISDASGRFAFNNTSIQNISITSKKNNDGSYAKLSEFEITNDSELTSLILEGFKKVYIKGCNKLKDLTIDGKCLEELTIDMLNTETNDMSSALMYINGTLIGEDGLNGLDMSLDGNGKIRVASVNRKDEYHQDSLYIPKVEVQDGKPITKYGDGSQLKNPSYEYFLGKKVDSVLIPGVYNFRGCEKLNKLSITNCNNVVVIKLPNRVVETNTFAYNYNLEYIDTDDVFYSSDKDKGNYPNSKLIITRDSTFKGCSKYSMHTSSYDFYNPYEWTNIEVSETCEDLSYTWSTDGRKEIETTTDDRKYNKFQSSDASHFISCIKNKGGIKSLYSLFEGRRNLGVGRGDSPCNLSEFTSLTNISRMYYDTNVNFISKEILSLPSSLNTPDNPLEWTDILKGAQYEISLDALTNVSYRINDFKSKKFIIMTKVGNSWEPAGKNEYFNIVDFLRPVVKYDEETGDAMTLTNISDLTNVSFDETQYIDFSEMFEILPNVKTLSGFMNDNLSKFRIEGMLKPCKGMVSITESFGNSNNESIDLWNFFDWEHNDTIENLFEGRDGEQDSFIIKKHIYFDDFKKLMTILSGGSYEDGSEVVVCEGYKKLSSLTNLFRNCEIRDYDGGEITLDSIMSNVRNISHLFDGCYSDIENGIVNIRRSFFEKLPSVERLIGTFRNVHFNHMLDFDFFCKRKAVDVPVKVDSGDGLIDAVLHEYQYGDSIFKMADCFNGCKFYGNESAWFVPDDIDENYVMAGDDFYDTYYDTKEKVWKEVRTYEKEDCFNNFSNFTKSVSCLGYGSNAIEVGWNNHPLDDDLTMFENGYDIYDDSNGLDIFETYPCLPPDLLYGCGSMVTLDNLFANSNVIGVIPRHFTMKCKNANMVNIFKNVNILPNVQFFYNKNGVDEYISMIESIPVDDLGESESEPTGVASVIFTNENGDLRRRVPSARETDIGQFVYVPDNFVGGNTISGVFNFRYNLPKNTNIDTTFLEEKWDGSVYVKAFKNTMGFDDAVTNYKKGLSSHDPYGNAHHTQYFFTTDKSCDWQSLINAINPFINDYDDVILYESEKYVNAYRPYYYKDSSVAEDKKYMWVKGESADKLSSGWSGWNTHTNGNFNVFLNLCGRRGDDGELVDYGCRVDLKKGVKLASFVTGPLVTFLNGLIFSTDFRISEMNVNNGVGDVILFSDETHFSKNIILPNFTGEKYKPLVFIQGESDYHYYDFMVDDDSRPQYESTEQNTDGTWKGFKMIFTKSYKYRTRE